MSYHTESVKSKSTLTIFWLFFLAIIVISFILGYFYRHKIENVAKPLVVKVENIHSWLLSKRSKKEEKNLKPIVAKEKPVHFEFYSALEAMELKAENKPENAAKIDKEKKVKPAILQPFIASREELEKEFAEKIDETETKNN